MINKNELLLLDILNKAYPNEWISEYMGIQGRKFRFDAVNLKHMVVVELEGGTHPIWITKRLPDGTTKKFKASSGRHNNPEGYAEDCRKYNLAQINGWKILRYTTEQVLRTPWIITEDLYLLIGAPTNGQSRLCFDNMQTNYNSVQVKIS